MILLVHSLVLEAKGPGDLFKSADDVADALIDLEESTPALRDSTLSVDKGQNLVTIEVSVEAETFAEAEAIATQISRRAAVGFPDPHGSFLSQPTEAAWLRETRTGEKNERSTSRSNTITAHERGTCAYPKRSSCTGDGLEGRGA